jgi:hypothetical protein
MDTPVTGAYLISTGYVRIVLLIIVLLIDEGLRAARGTPPGGRLIP